MLAPGIVSDSGQREQTGRLNERRGVNEAQTSDVAVVHASSRGLVRFAALLIFVDAIDWEVY